ncbi:hypothetical protein [Schleiferilactobacillus perolens]|uniref:hypothetical protein n=1 Tax=Schleiferilactobacillus perolens TaxID=100468 RepID=UPI0039E7B1D3
MDTRYISFKTTTKIYERKERQMRDELLQIIDYSRGNTDLIDDPEYQRHIEQAAAALDDLEWIDSNEAKEKAADEVTSGGIVKGNVLHE